jgi:hypothetical protein
MIFTAKRMFLFLIILCGADFAVAQAHNSPRLGPISTTQEHLKSAAALEGIGFYKESEAELLAALVGANASERSEIAKELQRIREIEKGIETARSDQNSSQYLTLGDALERDGHFDQALMAFQRAYGFATSVKAQALAQESISRVLSKKESFNEKYIRGFVPPMFVKFVLGVLEAIGLCLLLWFLYSVVEALGKRYATHSNRIEVAEFDDTTETGLGKAFPAVLHAVYEEYQNRVQRGRSNIGATLLAYRSGEATLPVMGSPKYEDFSEIKLDLPGIDVSELLRKLNRLIRRPYYTVGGVIYRLGEEIRSTAKLTKYNGNVNRWDRSLWGGPGSSSRLTGLAYDIIAGILNDWNAKTHGIK